MNRRRLFSFTAVLLSLVLCAGLLGQYTQFGLGRSTLYAVRSASIGLTQGVALRAGLTSMAYLSAVGGVTFERVARPAHPIQQLELQYDATKPDGQRVWVNTNGRRLQAPAYDWQLIPVARFADSRFTACFTLFGKPDELGDAAAAERVKEEYGRVIKFHPAFKNTLLGLRLMQLDMLIISEDATELPKSNGDYVLGRGETAPDLAANRRAATIIKTALDQLAERRQSFHSYVINDQNTNVSIASTDGYLVLGGDPSYYSFNIEGEGKPGARPVANRSMNRWLAENREMVRSINPAVWDTAVNTMRYAAFFRYCKRQNPEAWRSFLSQIRKVTVTPTIITPDVVIDPREKERAEELTQLLLRLRQQQPNGQR